MPPKLVDFSLCMPHTGGKALGGGNFRLRGPVVESRSNSQSTNCQPNRTPLASGSRRPNSIPVDCLARGEQLLERLAKEAQAARAEARHAELRQLLADAHFGNLQPLKQWLLRYDSPASEAPLSWEVYRQAATGRLMERSLRLAANPTAAIPDTPCTSTFAPTITSPDNAFADTASPDTASPDTPPANTAIGGRARPGTEKQFLQPAAVDAAAEVRRPTKPGRGKGAAHSGESTNTRKIAFSPTVQAPRETKPGKSMVPRTWGIMASVLLHLLLGFGLAMLAIQLPPQPAGLALDSSWEVASPDVALSQPLDVASPIAESEPLPELDNELKLENSLSESSAQPPLATQLSGGTTPFLAGVAASGAGLGPTATAANFFGADATGNCFCYVIDSSMSMQGGAWEAAKSELMRSLNSLQPNQRFYIVFFNQKLSAIPLPGENDPARFALYAESQNIEHARRWIDTIRLAKGAPPTNALSYAIQLEPDAIYLLTDGVTTSDVGAALKRFNRAVDLIDGEQVKVPIHAVAFYSLDGQQLMRRIAAENQGKFIYVPNPLGP